MRNNATLTLRIALICLLAAGCEQAVSGPAPLTVAEYEQMGKADRLGWPDNRIVQINLTRVTNSELTEKQRLDSLELVSIIGTDEQTDLADLATLLREPKCPAGLHRGVLLFLLKQKYPDLAAYTTAVMENPKADPQLRKAVMAYWGEAAQPGQQMLASIVRSWARKTTTTGPGEENFRRTVGKISNQSWDVALLNELNTKAFPAKGEALRVLRDRLPAGELRKRILAVKPKTTEMRAIQTCVEKFDYLPADGEELTSSEIIYRARGEMLPDAARLCLDWNRNYKYSFNIRDFHLLSRLARDPLRNNLKRTQIVLEIGQALKTRRHVSHTPATAGGPDDYKDSFWLQVDHLTMADLWNLYLINEMLSRPRVQVSLRLMADGDLADTRSAWGGLVFYENGQAEAKIYPTDRHTGGNDLIYQPSRRLITDGRDSLCRFIGHFDKVQNATRAGPSADELDDAREYNYYGLVLTRVDKNSFCAHYYSPAGLVVSLGKFPLR